MFRKLIIIVCLMSFLPAAAGAQEIAALAAAQPVQQSTEQAPARELNLMPTAQREAAAAPVLVAANDMQGHEMSEGSHAKKTHHGLTFQEFVDVHFGEYRWIYWVGAVAAIVALHVVAAD